jgi:hypothetical protein
MSDSKKLPELPLMCSGVLCRAEFSAVPAYPPKEPQESAGQDDGGNGIFDR